MNILSKKNLYKNFMTLSNVFTWIISIIIFFLLDKAKPPFETCFNRIRNKPLRKYWDSSTLEYVFYFLVFLLIVHVICIIINLISYLNKKDALHVSHIIISLSSLIGIILYCIHF